MTQFRPIGGISRTYGLKRSGLTKSGVAAAPGIAISSPTSLTRLVTITGATGGTWTFTIPAGSPVNSSGSARTTAPIAWNADAITVREAVRLITDAQGFVNSTAHPWTLSNFVSSGDGQVKDPGACTVNGALLT